MRQLPTSDAVAIVGFNLIRRPWDGWMANGHQKVKKKHLENGKQMYYKVQLKNTN
jgi:hypothetical protein